MNKFNIVIEVFLVLVIRLTIFSNLHLDDYFIDPLLLRIFSRAISIIKLDTHQAQSTDYSNIVSPKKAKLQADIARLKAEIAKLKKGYTYLYRLILLIVFFIYFQPFIDTFLPIFWG